MKLLLTAILRGDSEIELAKRMLDSFMPHFDGLVVAITGLEKHDETRKLVKRWKGHVIDCSPETHPKLYLKDGDHYIFGNFAEARNVTFEFADTLKGYDWYSWADVDDILISGKEVRVVAETALKHKIDSVFFNYWYSILLRPDRTFDETCVQIEHQRERLLKPGVFKWISRLHEVAVPKDGNYKPTNTAYEYSTKEGRLSVWAHITDIGRSRAAMMRNIRILELQIKEEDHKDPRTVFYLAKTYYDLNDKEKDSLALFLLDEYLNGKYKSGWNEERANAWQYVGNILARRNRHQEAVNAFFKSLAEYPNNHMTFIYLSREYALMGLFDYSEFWCNQVVMRLDDPKARTTIGNPLEVRYLIASLKLNEAARKNNIQEAIKWQKIRLELSHEKSDDLLRQLESSFYLNESAKWIFNYAKWLKDTGHGDKVRDLLKALPPEHGQEAFASIIANDMAEPKVWGPKTIVYFASWGGRHFEKWSPKNMEKGIGGSETAVIELAKRWVKLGYDVYVYGDPQDEAGDYDGVHYRPWFELNWKDTFNTLILWRSPHLLDRDIKAKRLYMDLHDVASNLDWTNQRVQKIDKVFFKSKYHRAMVPNLPDEKVAVISNGL